MNDDDVEYLKVRFFLFGCSSFLCAKITRSADTRVAITTVDDYDDESRETSRVHASTAECETAAWFSLDDDENHTNTAGST